MQTRCWDEKGFVSFHLLLAAFLGDVGKQVGLLLPHLENFKSPSEIKTGQNSPLPWRHGSLLLLAWTRLLCSHSHPPCLSRKKSIKTRRLDLVDLSSGLLKLRHVAVMNVYVNIKAHVLQREEAETAIYVSRVTSQQRGRTKWIHRRKEHNTNEWATAKTPNTLRIST